MWATKSYIKDFFVVMSIVKWPPPNPSWSSYNIFYASFMVPQHQNMLFRPIEYIIPSSKVKGFVFLPIVVFECEPKSQVFILFIDNP